MMRRFSLAIGLIVLAVSVAMLNPDATAGCRRRPPLPPAVAGVHRGTILLPTASVQRHGRPVPAVKRRHRLPGPGDLTTRVAGVDGVGAGKTSAGKAIS